MADPSKPKPARPVAPPQDLKSIVRPGPRGADAVDGAKAAPAAKPAAPAPTGDTGRSAAAAGPPPRKNVAELGPVEIAALRQEIVELLREKKRSGETVTMMVEHKELTFTGRVVRVEPEEGYAVLENVDGRRRGCYFILGGHLKTRDGNELAFPIDGVPR
ncbi:MAG TPA: hypothetical protein VE404_02485 [Verrucomicrobiae bacterium]|nr:hypothetical protein [Verrucomicrobiae bacterium]